jgi:uncharacterized protein
MKVVADTNIFVMAFSNKSIYHDIFKKLISGEYELVVTNDILLEYEEIMTQKYGELAAKIFLRFLDELPNVEFIRAFFHWNLIENDPDDNKFIDAVFASNAQYLVSQDKHFNILKQIDFPKIEVMSIDDFMKILEIQKL